MANFKYNKSITTTLKACGLIDTDNGTIDIDGETKSILQLISDFNGCEAEISVRVKTDTELEAPAESE